LNGTQVLIVCDPKTGEPARGADGKGVAYVNQGQYVEVATQVLDKYETKQGLDWEHPKEVRPFQVSVFAPNVPLTLTYNLQDINAHGGLWLYSTGNCVTWGQGRGYAKLLTDNPDDWLIVLVVTNPNPFPVSGKVDVGLWSWSNIYSGWPLGKSLTLTLGPNETKYVLVNRGKRADFLVREFSGYWDSLPVQGYTLANLYASNVAAENAGDFPELLKPAKGFYLADPNWRIYSDRAWPMRFGVYLEAATYVAIYPGWSTRSDGFKGYVWMDQEGKFHVDPNCTVYPYRLTREQIIARVENWFNSHKVADIPLVWYGASTVVKDGMAFDYCRPAAYWWYDTQGAFASWTEQMGPVLVGAKLRTNPWISWVTPKWAPAASTDQNPETYIFYWNGERRMIQGGKGTLFWGDRREWLPVFMTRLCFVHRYSFIPVQGDAGVLKEDVVPGYQMWIQTERALKLFFSHPLKKITATRHHFLKNTDRYYWLTTTWVYERGSWKKQSEDIQSFREWYQQPPQATWGRYYFVPYPDNSDPRSVGVTPDVWDVRVEYEGVLNAASELIGGEFRNQRGSGSTSSTGQRTRSGAASTTSTASGTGGGSAITLPPWPTSTRPPARLRSPRRCGWSRKPPRPGGGRTSPRPCGWRGSPTKTRALC
jgi:hypothetical protein